MCTHTLSYGFGSRHGPLCSAFDGWKLRAGSAKFGDIVSASLFTLLKASPPRFGSVASSPHGKRHGPNMRAPFAIPWTALHEEATTPLGNDSDDVGRLSCYNFLTR